MFQKTGNIQTGHFQSAAIWNDSAWIALGTTCRGAIRGRPSC